VTSLLARIGRNWRALTPEQRMAAIAALALLASMLLPWYQETGSALVGRRLQSVSDSKNAFQVYSFVEAAIFVVTVGVLALLWARAEGKAFHLPGGDGTVVMGAGLWVMFLIFYRQLDKPNGRHEGMFTTTIGVQWGIFIAFLLGAFLAWTGYRIRSAHVPEPAPGDPRPPAKPAAEAPARPPAANGPPPDADDDDDAPTAVAPRRRRPPVDDQLSFDEPAEYRPPPRSGGG
jgi:hypothetical protein